MRGEVLLLTVTNNRVILVEETVFVITSNLEAIMDCLAASNLATIKTTLIKIFICKILVDINKVNMDLAIIIKKILIVEIHSKTIIICD